MGMRSVCPRLFLLVIIQGINLVYSPQEPVDVALDLPAESLETQSVGTNKQLGFSHSCRMNTGSRRSSWSSVTFDSNRTCFCGWCIFCDRHTYHVNGKRGKNKLVFPFKSIRRSWLDMKHTMHDTLHILERANDGLQQDVSGLFIVDI